MLKWSWIGVATVATLLFATAGIWTGLVGGGVD